MSETAKILQFRPNRTTEVRSASAVRELVMRYLASEGSEREPGFAAACLGDADVLLGICRELADRVNVDPPLVASEAQGVYRYLIHSRTKVGVFDEYDYFLGEAALLAAMACRHLGQREASEDWLLKAEAAFRHTVAPAASLARASFERLALQFDMRRYDRVLEGIPALIRSFDTLEMKRQALRTRFLEAMALKDLGRLDDAGSCLESLGEEGALAEDVTLHGLVVAHHAEVLNATGRGEDAIELIRQSLTSAAFANQPLVTAHLKVAAAEFLRSRENLPTAAELYRGAIADYARVEMATQVAYLRVVLAEILLQLSRNREAEWQIAAALPAIEEQKMVPEGFAAISLLRESVRRRQTDSDALKAIREHLASKPN